MLYVQVKAAVAVEAKPQGTLTGVETQSAEYAAGLPAHRAPASVPVRIERSVTFFTNGLDPLLRSRHVFNFPRPETLAE